MERRNEERSANKHQTGEKTETNMTGSTTTRRSLLAAGGFAAAASLVGSATKAQSKGRTYVLVHGAWFGGWVWKQVAEGLRAEGHTVYVPTLTGLGERRHLLRPGINLDTHVDDVVNLIEMEDLKDIVLVGWSYGGMVSTDVLARVTSRVASKVYLDAFVPSAGRSAASYTQRPPVEVALKIAADGKDLPPLTPAQVGITDPAMQAFVAARLFPHPVLTFLQNSKALPERPKIPFTYVLAGVSQVETFRPFYKMFQEDPTAQTHVINTVHTMMLTDPAGTLAILKGVR